MLRSSLLSVVVVPILEGGTCMKANLVFFPRLHPSLYLPSAVLCLAPEKKEAAKKDG